MDLFLYPSLIVFTALAGGSLPITVKPTGLLFVLLLNFSGGILLGVAFFHMLPESIEIISTRASYFIILGIIFLLLVERFITIHPCELEDCEEHAIGIPAFIGFSIHNFTDGVALGASMLVPKLSLLTFAAILLHKAPMAFALSTFLIREGYSRLTAILMNIAFAFMVPLGTFIAYRFLPESTRESIGYALAFSAGTFIYIALGDIVPNLHRSDKPRILSTSFLLSGIIIMLVSSFFIALME